MDAELNQTNEQATRASEETEVKTFTQEEVNQIVQDRLHKDRKDRADYDDVKAKALKYDELVEANKSDLDKAMEKYEKASAKAKELEAQLDALNKAEELRQIKEKVSSETGVPAGLLTGATEEECTAQAKLILEFAKPKGYAYVPDGGEVTHTSSSTAGQFADWFHQQF